MDKVKFLILGAGVSGLSFANNIKSEDYCIIDRESEVGGYCRTIKHGEFVWDYAGHFFHFSHPQLKEYFKQVTDSNSTVHRIKNTKIYYKGYYVDYPFQKNIHQLKKDEMIDCLYDLFFKKEKDKYENFQDMLYGKFGRGITEKFLRPYNEKLYACNLNLLDVDAMGRFFPYADIKDIVSNMKRADNSSYNQDFLYPKEGAAAFVEILLKNLESSKIHLEENIVHISTEEHIVKTDKAEYKYEYLISSIPLNVLTAIVDINKQIDTTVFSYNQVLVLNLGFDNPPRDKEVHWIYIPDKEINFYRAGYYNNILGTENLSMYIEIGYMGETQITQEEIDKQLDLTIENLRKMNIIDKHKLIAYQPIVMNPAYVHITQESLKEVSRIKEVFAERNIYTVGRYGDWKYCSIEDCMIDSLNLVKEIINEEK